MTPTPTGDGLDIPSAGQAALAADHIVAMLGEQLDTDLTLVLDDVHELGDSDTACLLLGDLVRERRARLHLVLSSRADPPFPGRPVPRPGCGAGSAGSRPAILLCRDGGVVVPLGAV